MLGIGARRGCGWAILSQVPLFERFTNAQYFTLAKYFVPRTYSDGELLIEQGKFGTSLFIILRGTVRVVVNGVKAGRALHRTRVPRPPLELLALVQAQSYRSAIDWYTTF